MLSVQNWCFFSMMAVKDGGCAGSSPSEYRVAVSFQGVRAEAATMSPYLAELPELVRVGLQHCNAAFVYQG